MQKPNLCSLNKNWLLFNEFPLAEELLPHKNLLLKFPSNKNELLVHEQDGFNEFKGWLEEELKKSGIQRESKWILKITYFLPSFAYQFHAIKNYDAEREVFKGALRFSRP